MKQKSAIFIVLLIAITVVYMMYRKTIKFEEPKKLDSSDTYMSYEEKPLIRIGIISRYSPPLIYEGYQSIADYLSEKSSYNFELTVCNSYMDTVNKLICDEVDVAFLGTLVYIKSLEKYDLEAILLPLNSEGQALSKSVVIARDDFKETQICDLPKFRLALPSKDSFSGRWFLKVLKESCGDLSENSIHYENFNYHQTVVFKVLKHEYDLGVVKHRVAEDYLERGLKIVLESYEIPSSPIVIKNGKDPVLIKEFTDLLLNADLSMIRKKNWDQEFFYGFKRADEEDNRRFIALKQKLKQANDY